ncbi:hypothetical protein ABW19_dt0202150 [Dactylella cylindrospora]|nr:hypothetical protein ABW19_dt0202150 [Dactylella cylindrospora]
MVSKPKNPPAKASGSSSAAAPSTPVKSSTPVQTPAAPVAQPASSSAAPAVPETPTPAPQAPAAQSTPATFGDPSSLAVGSAREIAIQQMTDMGFARPDVEAAMRAAYNNPDRAVEYLMNGIPEHLQRDSAPAQSSRRPPAEATPASAPAPEAESAEEEPINLFDAAAAQRQGNRGSSGARAGAAAAAGGVGAAGGAANLEFLRNNAQFQQLRQVVQQNPNMLEPILQQVGHGNPQLAQLIGQNPSAFLQLLSEGADNGDDDIANLIAGGGGADPPGTMTIQVTEDERAAIERLCGLGFDRDLVIQAYLACDKDEQLAANFLFDQLADGSNP